MTNINLTTVIKKSCLALTAFSLTLSTSLYALEQQETDTHSNPIEYSISDNSIVTVPVLDNALVFASLTDEMPAVVNYFTSEDEASIISFYEKSYGDIINRVNRYGRLTLTFINGDNMIRVAITQQNQKRQVDIIVEQSVTDEQPATDEQSVTAEQE